MDRGSAQSLGPSALEVRDRVIELLPTLPAPGYRDGATDNRLPQFTRWLGKLGADGLPAIEPIIAVLRSGTDPLSVLPTLGTFGAAAAPARPAIEPLLAHSMPLVRAQAAATLARTAGVTADSCSSPKKRWRIEARLPRPGPARAGGLPGRAPPADCWQIPTNGSGVAAADAIGGTRDHTLVMDTLRAAVAPTATGHTALALLAEMPVEAVVPLRDQLREWLERDQRLIDTGPDDERVEQDEDLRELATRILDTLSTQPQLGAR